LIESGEMNPFPNDPTLWDFLPEVPVPAGTEVIVHVAAVDCMGGIAVDRAGKIMGMEEE
jgi:hypothetical protein